MSDWKDDVRSEYQELKERFRDTTVEDFQDGQWFASMVRWLLSSYSQNVDAQYLRRKYPGVTSANQAKKAISLAAKHTAVAGGLAAGAITALELSSLGPQAMVTVPAVGAAVMGDVAFSTRTQLRSTYDLSVIHGAPLAMDDVEDCYLVFMVAMGVKLSELAGGVGKAVGPQVVAYNVRSLLRSGLRKSLQGILAKFGGTRLARQLTERAMMRLLVPGVSIPIAAGFNYYFTKKILDSANGQMRRRGKVVQPLVRLHAREPSLEKVASLKTFIAVVDTGDPEGWSEGQMDGLRHCQSTLCLSDEQLSRLDGYFDRSLESILPELASLAPSARQDLVELCTVGTALACDDRHDERYSAALSKLSQGSDRPMDIPDAAAAIRETRRALG